MLKSAEASRCFSHKQHSLVEAPPEQFQFELIKTANQSVALRAMLDRKSYTRHICSSSCSRLQKPVCFTRAKLFGKSYTRDKFSSSCSRPQRPGCLHAQDSVIRVTLETISVRVAQHSTQFQFELLKTDSASLVLYEQCLLVRATLETISVRVAQEC